MADSIRFAWAPSFLPLAILAACGPVATAGPGCQASAAPFPLDETLAESSGVAPSLRHPGVYWTHNDADPRLFGLDEQGQVIWERPLDHRFIDWEDLAVSACADHGSCLYAADIGDNYEEHPWRAVVRFAEPDPSQASAPAVETFPFRLPDGPRDMEAMLVLPGERILFVTKGRNHPITVYRYPGTLRPDTVVLEEVQRLTDGPRILPRQVTGGAAAPRGGVVALRTYQSLTFYRVVGDTLEALEGGTVNLRTLRESQGEGVGITGDGRVVLTSEGGPGGGPPSMALVRCSLEDLAL